VAREDITDWLIHFTKDVYSKNEVEVYEEIPSLEEEGIIELKFDYTNLFPVGVESLTAFEVLSKIISECGIRYGYSFRNKQTTIYGGEPVICFTEMPIKSLIKYAKTRFNSSNSTYAIAIKKRDAFKYGARPVIYGLSDENKFKYEIKTSTKRILVDSVLPKHEQYRLVPLKLEKGNSKSIDWTHEREWRWADLDEKFDFPGIPLFIKNDFFDLSTVIIIVYTNKEANQILGLLKSHHDSESTNYGLDLDKQILRNTLILSIESIEEEGDIENIRIDDLPFQKLPKIKEVKPSKECIEKVKQVWEETKNHAYNLAQEAFDKTSDNKLWEKYGPCGGAYVITFDGHSEITQALVELGIATAYTDHYSLGGLKTVGTQMMGIHEIKAKAAAIFLTEKLGQKFLWRTYID